MVRKVDRMLLLLSQGREHFDVEKINTWVRHNKLKSRGGGDGGRVVPEVRDNSHLSHKETV
jgi:hypothetical protein